MLNRISCRLTSFALFGTLSSLVAAGCVTPPESADEPVDASLASGEDQSSALGDDESREAFARDPLSAPAEDSSPGGGDDAAWANPSIDDRQPASAQFAPLAADAGAPASPGVGSFALYAVGSIELNSGAFVAGGNVGVESATGPYLTQGVSAYFNSGASVATNETLYASSVYLNSGALVGAIASDSVTSHSAAHGAVSAFPAMPGLPALPAATAGTTSETLNSGAKKALSAGSFGTVIVNSGATLTLTGGTYVFASLTLNSGATLVVTAATTVSVTGTATFGSGSFAGPAGGSGLTAKALHLDLDTSSGVSINSGAEVQALVLAPKALVTVNTAALVGALGASEVVLNSGAEIVFQDGFSGGESTCPASCDDGNACTTDACTGGVCTHTAVANGTTCNDGNACDLNDTCQTGGCTAGSTVTCTAPDACHTAGTCSPATGTCSAPTLNAGFCGINGACVAAGAANGSNTCETCQPSVSTTAYTNVANGTSCNDGNACTQTDACQSGTCTGSNPVTCTASDQCHAAGTCNPTSGACSNPALADGSPCNDGNACTQVDSCTVGACTGASVVVCVAADQCHVAGVCNPTSGACSSPAAPDGTTCSDGNGCTQSDECAAGLCVGANPVTCSASDQCHVAGSCDPASGTCSNPSANNGTPCNDGNACTQTDTCASGSCAGGNPVTCAAPDACHNAGTCDPSTGQCSGATTLADGTSCAGSSPCNVGAVCQAGMCSGGLALCATQECSSTACDPTTGCARAADGTPWSYGACEGGGESQGPPSSATYLPAVCVPGPQIGNAEGSPGLPCTASSGTYNVGLFSCVYAPLPPQTQESCGVCDGNNNCVTPGSFIGPGPYYPLLLPAFCPPPPSDCVTAGSIDLFLGECAYVNLAAGTACSAGTCDGAGHCGTGGADSGVDAGALVSAPCDDGLPCTADVVAADGTCAHYPVPDGSQCNDGAFCDQPGTCAAGACSGVAPWPSGFVCPGGACDGNSNCVSQDCTANPDGTPCNDGNTMRSAGRLHGGSVRGNAADGERGELPGRDVQWEPGVRGSRGGACRFGDGHGERGRVELW